MVKLNPGFAAAMAAHIAAGLPYGCGPDLAAANMTPDERALLFGDPAKRRADWPELFAQREALAAILAAEGEA